MDTKDQENWIHKMGRQLAEGLKGFYGSIEINVQNGTYINSNLKQSLKPENTPNSKQERTL